MTKAIVVGYGLAGGLAAIELHDLGCDVTIIEKMPMAGGISITSGGGGNLSECFVGADLISDHVSKNYVR
jgi:fumarate reductase flavoprotein subunit